MSFALANAARAVRARTPLVARQQVQRFSAEAHQAHHEATMNQWRKISFLAIPGVIALGVVNVVIHFSHGHPEHEEVEAPTYVNFRKKAFPWACK